MQQIRIGQGYDVHRLVKERDLIIGGVKIEYKYGLSGHSDADVLCHAISDAILGAAALGDIGKHFPDTDSNYKNADSIILLKKVNELILKKNYKVSNIDSTIIAQKPKLSGYIDSMRENISKAVNIGIEDISVKATTEERLGFTGQELGIAAHAVVLLEKI